MNNFFKKRVLARRAEAGGSTPPPKTVDLFLLVEICRRLKASLSNISSKAPAIEIHF